MSEERLHFEIATPSIHAMEATEYVARYAALAPFVRGKRVLDIACGEGYGTWLLKEWGASEVVGVDVSDEAIAAAQKLFGREGVNFIAGDACQAQDFLEHAGFDLIASFETVEHVHEPEKFLDALMHLAAPGAGIFISCPNDHIALSAEQSNPFHLRKYTFDEFRVLSERVLGSASQWLLGATVQGYGLVPVAEPLISHDGAERSDIVKTKLLSAAHLLPSQQYGRPDCTNVLYYLGVWGIQEPVSAVALSAQPYSAFTEPWKALNWFKAERIRMQAELDKMALDFEALNAKYDKLRSTSLAREADARHRIQALNAQVTRIGHDTRALSFHNDEELARLRQEAELRLEALVHSRSWRITKLYRVIGRLLRGEFAQVRDSVTRFLRKK